MWMTSDRGIHTLRREPKTRDGAGGKRNPGPPRPGHQIARKRRAVDRRNRPLEAVRLGAVRRSLSARSDQRAAGECEPIVHELPEVRQTGKQTQVERENPCFQGF